MTTATKTLSVQDTLNAGDPARQASAFEKMKVGYCLSPIKAVFSGFAATATVDITTAAMKAKLVTLAGIELDTGENMPPIGQIVAVRVAGGAASAGARFVSDSGATASTTVAKISDDGKSLTFEGTVAQLFVTYLPRPAVTMTDDLAYE